MEIPSIENCFFLGKVIRTHGYKGGLKIALDVDNPEQYRNLDMVYFELKKKLIPFFIESLHLENNKANLKLEDVDTLDQAERLLNANLFLPVELLPKLKGNKFYFHEIKGFTASDEKHGKLGEIRTVLELPNNPLLSIDHKGTEILIPIADEIIKRVDRKSKTVHLKAPEGLIELYIQ
jgi:16S rRNA processing protein RimM